MKLDLDGIAKCFWDSIMTFFPMCEGKRQSPNHNRGSPISFEGSGSPRSPFHKRRKSKNV